MPRFWVLLGGFEGSLTFISEDNRLAIGVAHSELKKVIGSFVCDALVAAVESDARVVQRRDVGREVCQPLLVQIHGIFQKRLAGEKGMCESEPIMQAAHAVKQCVDVRLSVQVSWRRLVVVVGVVQGVVRAFCWQRERC